MASIQDRWYVRRRDGTRVPSDRHGHGKRWVAWYDAGGARRSKAFDRRSDADAFLAQVRTEVLRGTYVDPDRGRRSFGSFATEWADAQTTNPSTREQVEVRLRKYILPTWERVELRAIRPMAVQRWLKDLAATLAPNTVKVTYANFVTILNAAVADEILPRNPATAASVTKPAASRRKVQPWTIEQVRTVIAAHPDRYRPLPQIAAACALRQGELFGLALDDIDFLRRLLYVRRQVKIVRNTFVFSPPKFREPDEPPRAIPLPDTLGLALSDYIRRYPPTEVTLPWIDPDATVTRSARLLVTSREHHPLNRNYINAFIWKHAVRDAGLDTARAAGNGMHALRHFCASNWLDQGVSIKAIAEYLGHRDEAFTLRTYTHLMPRAEDKARHASDQLLADPPDADGERDVGGEPDAPR